MQQQNKMADVIINKGLLIMKEEKKIFCMIIRAYFIYDHRHTILL